MNKRLSIKKNIAVALDNLNRKEALDFVRDTKDDLGFYKIGLELFLKYGKSFVEEIAKEDVNIFLDLKLHDIPTTVAKSIQALAGLNIQYLTLHLAGGPSMLNKAIEARDQYLPNAKILGVSYLTSMDQSELMNVFHFKNVQEISAGFDNLFQIASAHKIDGVVHSGEELGIAKNYSFISVCPGIRFLDEINNQLIQDQKRVMTPEQVLSHSSSEKMIILVIGRSLTTTYGNKTYQQRINYLKKLFDKLP